MTEASRDFLNRRVEETLHTFGLDEGNAILKEVFFRMGDGGSVGEWLDMIETVAMERHPYLRYAQERPN